MVSQIVFTLVFYIGIAALIGFIAYNIANQQVGRNTPSAATHSVRFKNLVLHSGYNTVYTEIDEVVVSQYGIFCIEEKGYSGIIIGDKYKKNWTQYQYGSRVSHYNPLHQNYKHIKALEKMLGKNLKYEIRSLALYTNAHKVNVNSSDVFHGRDQLEEELSQYTNPIYTIEEYERICKILAHASTMSSGRMKFHITDVQRYLAKEGAQASFS